MMSVPGGRPSSRGIGKRCLCCRGVGRSVKLEHHAPVYDRHAVSSSRFRFGSFLVSPAHRALRRGDDDVPIIPRYFDLLVLLLDQRHRVVTRQEIFDRVWADVVVSDGALSQAVRTIRRCLDDDPRESRFIRTVSRQGYQFVAGDVQVLIPHPGMDASGGLLSPDRLLAVLASANLWIGVVAGLVLIAAAIWLRGRRIETSV